MDKELSDLLYELAECGGALVSSDSCHEIEIAQAQASGCFAVDDFGHGFVLRSSEWLQSRDLAFDTCKGRTFQS